MLATIRKLDPGSEADIGALCAIARELYVETFGPGYERERSVPAAVPLAALRWVCE